MSRNSFKTEIKTKLNLIYDSKYQINTKWWKIKMKTRNLTQSTPWNDPINYRMHGYSFHDLEDEDGVQDVISPHSFYQFWISNAPQMRKCVKKRNKLMDAWIVVFKQFDFTRKSKCSFRSRRTILFKEESGVTVDKSSLSSHERPIGDGGLRCVHVNRVKRSVFSMHPLDLHLAVVINRKIYQSRRTSAVITLEMVGRDYFT